MLWNVLEQVCIQAAPPVAPQIIIDLKHNNECLKFLKMLVSQLYYVAIMAYGFYFNELG